MHYRAQIWNKVYQMMGFTINRLTQFFREGLSKQAKESFGTKEKSILTSARMLFYRINLNESLHKRKTQKVILPF